MKNIEIKNLIQSKTINDGDHIVVDLDKSHDSFIVEAETGREYLDLSTQFASQALGWNHPRLLAIKEKLGRIALHKIANPDFYTQELAEFLEILSRHAIDFSKFFLVEGGSCGVNFSIAACCDYRAKKLKLTDTECNNLNVVHFTKSFSGRCGYPLSITNTSPNKVAFFPKFSWTRVSTPSITFPINLEQVQSLENQALLEIENAFKKNNVAAVVLESILGEGGDLHLRPEFFQQLRQLTTKYDIMLILDEVQSGCMITAKMWAYQHFGIVPDCLAFGKKFGTAGFCSTNKIDEVPDNVFRTPSRISSTFGGNLVDMVRSTAILQAIDEDNLQQNVIDVGSYLLDKLHNVDGIENVRGRGLMIAFDLPTTERRDQVLNKIKERASILPCGDKSIRLRPHLTFTKENADLAIEIIKNSI